MSVRAYKIKKIITNESPTFNWYHDTEPLELMERYVSINDQTNDDACGIYELDADEFLEFHREVWAKMKKDRLSEHLKRSTGGYQDNKVGNMSREELTQFIIECDEVYKDILKDCKESIDNGEYWVQYLCY